MSICENIEGLEICKKPYQIRNSILDYMQNNLTKVEGSYNFDLASANSYELSEAYTKVNELSKQLLPWTVDREPYISYHMKSFGLERLTSTKARGEVEITGKDYTLIPQGTIVVSRLGIRYMTTQSSIIELTGKAKIPIEAIEGGISGNAGIGDITGFEIVLTNIYSVTNPAPITGGAEIETVESCRERMYIKASVPSHSGNKNNYEGWARETGGVGKVKVVSAGEYGVPPGSVDIYIGDAQGNPPSTEQLKTVQDYIDLNRPVNAKATVKAFVELNCNIRFNEVTVKRGSMSKQQFIDSFKAKLKVALATKGFIVNDIIPLAKIGNLTLNIENVILYDALTLNGSSGNLSLAYNQIAQVGAIEVISFVEI